jgi:hypothetical protein
MRGKLRRRSFRFSPNLAKTFPEGGGGTEARVVSAQSREVCRLARLDNLQDGCDPKRKHSEYAARHSENVESRWWFVQERAQGKTKP